MKLRTLTAAVLVASTTLAYADPHKILVLQSEGRVEAAQRAKIDAGIVKLAKSTGAEVSPGDTTMSDAAAAVGCKPETQACREEIMGMLSVDELVYATLTAKPGGTEVEVHRVTKTGTTDAKTIVGANSDKLDGVAPLFGGAATGGFTPPGSGPTRTPPGGKAPPPPTNTLPPPVSPPPTDPALTTGTPTTGELPPNTTLTPANPPPDSVVATPPPVGPGPGPVDEGGHGRRRLELAGMIGGGALVLVGFMCWGSASDIQSQINDAPTQTKPQLDALVDLEKRGDSYAAWGNVLFLSGAVIGGVSTYFFLKDRRAHRHATSAAIAPTVFDHGAGLALTFGAAQ